MARSPYADEVFWTVPQPIAQLAGNPNEINGTPDDDYLTGTYYSDLMNGGDGNDTFYGQAGDDVIRGGGGTYNQADYDGVVADYSFVRNADGTITVSNATYGTDTLSNIHGFWFYGEDQWYSSDQLAPLLGGEAVDIGTGHSNYYGGTNFNDTIRFNGGNGNYVDGGAGRDVISFTGPMSSYKIIGEGEHFTISNGSGSAIQFKNVEEISFPNATDVSLASIVAASSYNPGDYWLEALPISGLVVTV